MMVGEKVKEAQMVISVTEETPGDLPVKFDLQKHRPTLLPPHALCNVSHVMTYGANKYGDDNYLKGEGLEPKRLVDAGLRHILEYLTGTHYDKESGFHSLAHATASLMMALEVIHKRSDENE